MRFTGLALSLWLITGTNAPISAGPTSESASTGMLSIVSDPAGAIAYVDGHVIGRTPISASSLAAGDHRVRLVKEGYLENGRIVTVTRGRTHTVQVRLTVQPVTEAAFLGQVRSGSTSGGSNKKWLYIALAGGAAAAAAVVVAGRNHAPTVGTVAATPSTGLQSSTTITFSAEASDTDNDPLTYSWDFGDGGTSTSKDTTHLYTSAAAFTVKLTVSDGKASASGQATVTIKSLTGAWRSGPVPYVLGGVSQGTMQWVFNVTQSSAAVTGSLQAAGAVQQLSSPGTISGSVRSTSPIVSLLGNVPSWLPPTFTLDPNPDITTLNGRWIDSGSNSPITFTRQ